MKPPINKLLLAALCLLLSSVAQAQVPAPTPPPQPTPLPSLLPPKWELREEPPDASKGEESVRKEFSGGVLTRVNITYTDKRRLIQEYGADGKTLNGEAESLANGTIKIRKYRLDGKLCKEMVIGKSVGFEETDYRADGKSKWTRSVKHTESFSEYYDEKGILRLRRDSVNGGAKMTVQVFNDAGKVLYEQVWMRTPAGYRLQLVTEKTDTGAVRRRIFVNSNQKVDSIDYLKADGTVEKSETGATLSEPVLPQRLREFNAKDDLTAPPVAPPTP